MRTPAKILLLVIGGYVVAQLMFILNAFLSRDKPADYVNSLSLDPKTYNNVTIVSPTDLGLHSYAYEKNSWVPALGNGMQTGKIHLPKLANANGNLPAFRMGNSIFIIISKWKNSSSGLAISNEVDFKKHIEGLETGFEVTKLKKSIYAWELDLEADAR